VCEILLGVADRLHALETQLDYYQSHPAVQMWKEEDAKDIKMGIIGVKNDDIRSEAEKEE
jgi:hypothetical protein